MKSDGKPLWTVAAWILALIFGASALYFREQAQRARTDYDHALVHRERALEVTQFLVDQFRLDPPRSRDGGVVTARELLDQSTRRVEEERELLPTDRAAVLGALGGAYVGLGLYDPAERLLHWSLSLRRKQGLAPDSDLVITLTDLAIVHRLRGGCAEAQRLQAEAEKLVVEEGVGSLRLASFLNDRAYSLNNRWADPRAAEVFYRLALTIKERELGEQDPALARTRHNLAVALELQGKYGEAARHLDVALELRRAIHGDQSMEVARTLNALVALLQHTDDLDRAARYARESLEIRQRERPQDVVDIARAQNSLAVILRLQGHFDVAERLLRQAVVRLQEQDGEGHRGLATVLTNLASVERARGDAVAAESDARRAVELYRETLAAEHWQIADAESVLGGCLLDLGRLAEAEPLLARTLPRLEIERGESSRYAREARERFLQLAAARGLTEDETKAWMLSLRSDPSAQPRVCR